MRKLFEQALEHKRDEARRRSRRAGYGPPPRVSGVVNPAREAAAVAYNTPQGVIDPRVKSAGHGQKTADKWNQ
ncbi:MAG: hypothetical protein JWQ48_43 [Conexibacter sp.]|nr:hypothetical protein [Conexibacter sp.]